MIESGHPTIGATVENDQQFQAQHLKSGRKPGRLRVIQRECCCEPVQFHPKAGAQLDGCGRELRRGRRAATVLPDGIREWNGGGFHGLPVTINAGAARRHSQYPC